MKVFVSSTYEDLKGHRAAARRAIQKLGHQPIMMEDFVSSSKPPKNECLDKVEESDVLVGIYAHRYGFVPKGDEISLTEQEYRLALSKGKEVYCFLVSPEAKWPEGQKDSDERLKKFLSDIKLTHTVSFFESPEDIVVLVSPVIVRVHEEHMGPWQKAAKKIDNREKLEMINNLIGRNNKGELSDIALKSSTKLLASDFNDFSPSTTFEFIGHTGRLLQGNLWIGEYVRHANRLSIESTPRKRWNEKARDNIRRLWRPVLVSVLIGLLLGVLSYVFNWYNVREKYLKFSGAKQIDLANWLINKKVEGRIKFDAFGSEETRHALYMLGLALELEPGGTKTNEYFEKLIKDMNSRISYYKNPPPELRQENLKNLEIIHQMIPPEAKPLQARVAVALLKSLEQDPSVGYEKLLSAHEEMLRKYAEYIDKVLYQQKIDSLKQAKEKFEFQKAKQASQNLTIFELIKSWQNYAALSKDDSPEQAYAKQEIHRLKEFAEKYATIEDENNFVTCRGVDQETRQPIGVTDKFSPGAVWVWARINAPRAESVTFKWYTKEGEYHSNTAQITISTGYRVYFSRNYDIDHEGLSEVRLYNSQNILIGRRVFRIGVGAVTAK